MVIDTHAHIFPEKICRAAVKGISDFYSQPITCDGTAESLLELGKQGGITNFVINSVATTAAQVEHINDFLISSVKNNPDVFTGLMAMHPGYTDIQSEIDRCVKAGLKGIKLHPDFQEFCIDDKKAYPIYEAAQGRLPILFHTGDARYQFSKPQRLLKVMEDFPRLDVIGAHFGGWSEWLDAAEILGGKRLWVDCSSTSYWLPPGKITKLISAYGTEYVMFGSDYPMWNPADELEKLKSLNMTSSQLDMILYKNAAELYGIK